jgi:hypothetical protein
MQINFFSFSLSLSLSQSRTLFVLLFLPIFDTGEKEYILQAYNMLMKEV